jgi:heme/copper-type cytochrome/quinol oxidase subunit 2
MRALLLVPFSLALAVAALTGSPASAEEDPYTLTIKEHRFEPSEITLPADKKVVLTVKNLDQTPEEFESTELRREKVVPGGQQATIYIGPLKPGRYEFFGDFNSQTAQSVVVIK